MSEDYNNKDNQLRVKSFEPNLVQILKNGKKRIVKNQ